MAHIKKIKEKEKQKKSDFREWYPQAARGSTHKSSLGDARSAQASQKACRLQSVSYELAMKNYQGPKEGTRFLLTDPEGKLLRLRNFTGEAITCSVAQSCPTLYDHMDCSLPGPSVHGIFQARILEWVAMPFSRGSFQPRCSELGSACILVGRRVIR